ncbi:molybdopterin-binding protein [Lagierella sp.]|uniref:molybdopterin-binding protein n=1 Tax=Lagierella sp. TaxID=2849657 RepID=UPI002636BE59|nr:molybdopterin-binding protein [Lagierella sp.]
MKKIRVEDAIGHILPHDMTKIVKGEFKGPAFKKGHIIKEEDIPKLLDMGKEHIYVIEKDENKIHEVEAAKILGDICLGDNMYLTDVSEGKIGVKAAIDGFFQVDKDRLFNLNMIDEVAISTRMGNLPVNKDDTLAGARVIPLLIDRDRMQKAKELWNNRPILSLKPFIEKKVGVITTGSEVFHKRIKDQFTPVVIKKIEQYNSDVVFHKICDDDLDQIKSGILEAIDFGCDFIICTGGMSVDPDDMTPGAIKESGAKIISYGSPMLPGSMFLVSYLNNIPILGLPGCVMYMKTTVFDVILPYIFSDTEVTKEIIASLGYGGYCLNCETCHYPNCQYGKGI